MKNLIIALLLLPTVAFAEPAFEQPTTLQASQILSPELLVGPNHKVLDEVTDDGFLFHFEIDSRWGRLEAVSIPVLHKRIHEFNAMAEMEQLKGTDEFKNGVEQAASQLVSGGKNLVTDPGGSVKKIGKGIGGVFKSVGGLFDGKSSPRGSTEGNTLERVSGFSKTERQYAEKFGVDPYSRNEYLQKQLSDVSKAGFLGSKITSMGLGQLGGALVSVAGAVGDTNKLIHTESPDKLRAINQKRMQDMNVDDDVIDLFTRNTNFTITEQTSIVTALFEMENVEGRDEFIKFAVLSDNPDLANFRTLQANLYATYAEKWHKLARFIHLGEFSCGEAVDGSIIVAAPIDRLLWTQEMAEHILSLHQGIVALRPQARRVLWVTGTFSPRAESELKKLGWALRPQALGNPGAVPK